MDSSYAHLLSRTQREREDADYLTGFFSLKSTPLKKEGPADPDLLAGEVSLYPFT